MSLLGSPTAILDDAKAEHFVVGLSAFLILCIAVVVGAGILYGPKATEIQLSDGFCAFAKADYVYVGKHDNEKCFWLAMTQSRGWVSAEVQGHSVEMRAVWNAAEVKVDGKLFVIGKFRKPAHDAIDQVFQR